MKSGSLTTHKSLLPTAVALPNAACPSPHRPQPAKPSRATSLPIKFSSSYCGVFYPCFQEVKLQHTNYLVLQINQRAYTFLEKVQEACLNSLPKDHLKFSFKLNLTSILWTRALFSKTNIWRCTKILGLCSELFVFKHKTNMHLPYLHSSQHLSSHLSTPAPPHSHSRWYPEGFSPLLMP